MEGKNCRECHDPGVKEKLLSPCSCGGDRGYIHRSCLAQVIADFGTDKCPSCRSPYKGITVQREEKPFVTFLKESNKLRTTISATLMLTFGFYTVYLGIIQYYQSNEILFHRWNVILVIFIIIYTIVFTAASIMAAIQLRKDFKKWQVDHPQITVILHNPSRVAA